MKAVDIILIISVFAYGIALMIYGNAPYKFEGFASLDWQMGARIFGPPFCAVGLAVVVLVWSEAIRWTDYHQFSEKHADNCKPACRYLMTCKSFLK